MTIVPLHPVTSSAIESMGYEPSSGTLAVRFKGGRAGTHHYRDVPAEVYHRLQNASSLGVAFGQFVRDQYQCIVVPTERGQ